MFSLLPSSQAVVIGGFNNTLDNGWAMQSGHTSSFSNSVGVTEGTHSLQVGNVSSGYTLFIQSFNAAIRNGLLGQNAITLDVNRSNIIGANYFEIDVQLNGGAGPALTLGTISAPVAGTNTLTWNLNATQQSYISNSTNYFGLQLYVNTDATGGTFTIDKMQAIPEPSTALLLAISTGALFLLRQRTKKVVA